MSRSVPPASRLALSALAIGGSLLGCATQLRADDYDRTCNAAAECRVVFVGDPCSCSCDVSAIRASEYPQYLEDRGNPQCNALCGPCPGSAAACVEHVCQAVPQ